MNRHILGVSSIRWACAATVLICVASSSYWLAGLVQFSRDTTAAPAVLVMAAR